MGSPADDPWVALNAYNIHETSSWKGKLGLLPASHLSPSTELTEAADLNSKFVLGVYRDFVATQDKRFLADVWPAVDAALRHLQQFDR
jgi:non-lysosomal glucosylceramidase